MSMLFIMTDYGIVCRHFHTTAGLVHTFSRNLGNLCEMFRRTDYIVYKPVSNTTIRVVRN